MLKEWFYFLTSLKPKGNYALKPTPTQHDIKTLVGFPHFIKASSLTPVWSPKAGAMPPHFTYDGNNLTRRRGGNHKNMRHIQGSLITRSHAMVECNKGKMINGHNIPIMVKMHNSKECGHYGFHGINIIMSKKHIEIQRTLDHHNINTDSFPS